MGWVITVGGMLSLALVFVGFWLLRKETPTAARLAAYRLEGSDGSTAAKPARSGYQATLLKWARRVGPHFGELKSLLLPPNIDQRLAWAGRSQEFAPDDIFGLQILSVLVGLFFGFYAGFTLSALDTAILGGLILGGAAVTLPILWLDMVGNKRQRQIGRDVPDTVEMLATLVEAGLGFDGAFEHVTREIKGPLQEEYRTFLTQLEIGIPRAEALQRLIGRNKAPEIKALVGALAQGYELGVPIATTLMNQAEAARQQRLQRTKEEGAKVAPKIALITTFILAPAIMCLFITVMANDMVKAIGPLVSSFMGR